MKRTIPPFKPSKTNPEYSPPPPSRETSNHQKTKEKDRQKKAKNNEERPPHLNQKTKLEVPAKPAPPQTKGQRDGRKRWTKEKKRPRPKGYPSFKPRTPRPRRNERPKC